MTISTQNRTAGPFAGNDVTVAFPFTFKVFQATDLKVVRRVTATDTETTLVLNSNYTVTLNPNQNANPGGVVTLSSALATGQTLTVTTELPYLQATDLTNQGGFYPQVITNALDRLTIFAQQLFAGLGRSLKYPLSDSGIDPTLPGKDALRGRVLAFHETTGRPIAGPSTTSVGTVGGAIGAIQTVADNIADVNTVADSINDIVDFNDRYLGPKNSDPMTRNDGSPLEPGDLYFNVPNETLRTYTGMKWQEAITGAVSVQQFTGDGATVDFQLNASPDNENVVQVFVGGVYQSKTVYDITGNNADILTFTSAPPNNADIEVVTFSVLPLGVVDASQVKMPGGGTLDQLGAADSDVPVGGVPASKLTISVASIKDLATAPKIDGRQYSVAGFYAGSLTGGGGWFWDSARNKNQHNVFTILDPDRVAAWNGLETDLNTLYQQGAGNGCFVRIHSIPLAKPEIMASWAGVTQTLSDCAPLCQAIYNYLSAAGGGVLQHDGGDFNFASQMTVGERIKTKGKGMRVTRLLKKFNGDLVSGFGGLSTLEDLTIDGGSGTYTGRGIVVTGNNTPKIQFHRVEIINFTAPCVEFGFDAGSQFVANSCVFFAIGTNFNTFAAVKFTDDTNATSAHFIGCESNGCCMIDFGDCGDFYISGGFTTGLIFGTNSNKVFITNMRWGTSLGNRQEIRGNNHHIKNGASAVPVDIYGQFNSYDMQTINNDVVDYGSRNHVSLIGRVTFTPVWSATVTAPSIGNGTLTGVYSRNGSVVQVSYSLTVGSTTNLGSGNWRWSLPIPEDLTLQQVTGSGFTSGVTDGNVLLQARIRPGENLVDLHYQKAGSPATVAILGPAERNFAVGSTIRWSMTYICK